MRNENKTAKLRWKRKCKNRFYGSGKKYAAIYLLLKKLYGVLLSWW